MGPKQEVKFFFENQLPPSTLIKRKDAYLSNAWHRGGNISSFRSFNGVVKVPHVPELPTLESAILIVAPTTLCKCIGSSFDAVHRLLDLVPYLVVAETRSCFSR